MHAKELISFRFSILVEYKYLKYALMALNFLSAYSNILIFIPTFISVNLLSLPFG